MIATLWNIQEFQCMFQRSFLTSYVQSHKLMRISFSRSVPAPCQLVVIWIWMTSGWTRMPHILLVSHISYMLPCIFFLFTNVTRLAVGLWQTCMQQEVWKYLYAPHLWIQEVVIRWIFDTDCTVSNPFSPCSSWSLTMSFLVHDHRILTHIIINRSLPWSPNGATTYIAWSCASTAGSHTDVGKQQRHAAAVDGIRRGNRRIYVTLRSFWCSALTMAAGGANIRICMCVLCYIIKNRQWWCMYTCICIHTHTT